MVTHVGCEHWRGPEAEVSDRVHGTHQNRTFPGPDRLTYAQKPDRAAAFCRFLRPLRYKSNSDRKLLNFKGFCVLPNLRAFR